MWMSVALSMARRDKEWTTMNWWLAKGETKQQQQQKSAEQKCRQNELANGKRNSISLIDYFPVNLNFSLFVNNGQQIKYHGRTSDNEDEYNAREGTQKNCLLLLDIACLCVCMWYYICISVWFNWLDSHFRNIKAATKWIVKHMKEGYVRCSLYTFCIGTTNCWCVREFLVMGTIRTASISDPCELKQTSCPTSHRRRVKSFEGKFPDFSCKFLWRRETLTRRHTLPDPIMARISRGLHHRMHCICARTSDISPDYTRAIFWFEIFRLCIKESIMQWDFMWESAACASMYKTFSLSYLWSRLCRSY